MKLTTLPGIARPTVRGGEVGFISTKKLARNKPPLGGFCVIIKNTVLDN